VIDITADWSKNYFKINWKKFKIWFEHTVL
jgi:hypothetical protein